MVLRENNCGMKDIFCGYTVQGRGVQSQCYFSILFSPTISSLWVIGIFNTLLLPIFFPLYPLLVSGPSLQAIVFISSFR